jgi:hypothetical protein
MIPVGFIVGIAKFGFSDAGLETQSEVDHGAGVARIERPREERLVSRERSRIDADSERQGKNRHRGEPGIAEQGACPVTQVVKYGFEQDHHIASLNALVFKFIPAFCEEVWRSTRR